MNTREAKEIERLRTAMVIAMGDCETEANETPSEMTRKVLRAIAMRLRKALEKK